MNLMSRTCVGLLACATFFTAVPALAGPDDAEYNRLRMNEAMADKRYSDRINAPVSNTSTPSSSNGYGAPTQWQPRGPGRVVATYEFKIWVQETPGQAVARLRQEAAGGNWQSQFDLGRVLYAGYREVPVDLPTARKMFLAAAEQGHPPAQTQAGAMLYWGQGGAADKAAALDWVKKSADQGDSYGEALYGLWSLIEARTKSSDEPAPQALSYLRKAAGHGEMLAQRALFTVYFYGASGAKQDLGRAFSYAKLAAEQGDPASMNDVATCYMMGYGAQKDEAAAVPWLKEAATRGNTDAQVNYSAMLSQGRLVPQDLAGGARFSRMAAEKGDVNGQVLLAKSYYFGEGVKKDLRESVRWFRKAAAQGNKEAAEALAEAEMVQAAQSL